MGCHKHAVSDGGKQQSWKTSRASLTAQVDFQGLCNVLALNICFVVKCAVIQFCSVFCIFVGKLNRLFQGLNNQVLICAQFWHFQV